MGTFITGFDSVSYQRVTQSVADDYGTQTVIWTVDSAEDSYWDFIVTSLRSQNASGDFGGQHSWVFNFETQNRNTLAWVLQKSFTKNFPGGLYVLTGNPYKPVQDSTPEAIIYRLGPGDRLRLTKTHSVNSQLSMVIAKWQRPHNLWTQY